MGVVTRIYTRHWRDFDTTSKIISHSSIEVFGRPYQPNFELNAKMGCVVSKLVYDLMSIDGVRNVWLHPYEITVSMAHAFEWNPRIDLLIENAVAQLESGKNSSGNIVLIETHPNPRRRSFHTNREVSQTYLKLFDRPLLGYESDLRKVGTLGEKIIRDIFNIPGVTKISIQSYEIGVEIGKAFSWDDIEPKVSLAILFGFII